MITNFCYTVLSLTGLKDCEDFMLLSYKLLYLVCVFVSCVAERNVINLLSPFEAIVYIVCCNLTFLYCLVNVLVINNPIDSKNTLICEDKNKKRLQNQTKLEAVLWFWFMCLNCCYHWLLPNTIFANGVVSDSVE